MATVPSGGDSGDVAALSGQNLGELLRTAEVLAVDAAADRLLGADGTAARLRRRSAESSVSRRSLGSAQAREGPGGVGRPSGVAELVGDPLDARARSPRPARGHRRASRFASVCGQAEPRAVGVDPGADRLFDVDRALVPFDGLVEPAEGAGDVAACPVDRTEAEVPRREQADRARRSSTRTWSTTRAASSCPMATAASDNWIACSGIIRSLPSSNGAAPATPSSSSRASSVRPCSPVIGRDAGEQRTREVRLPFGGRSAASSSSSACRPCSRRRPEHLHAVRGPRRRFVR